MLLSALIIVMGCSKSLEDKAMKKIACSDGTIATKVQAILARHGILHGFYDTGPSLRDPTVQLVLTVAIDPTAEPTIRREVESIDGVKIRD